jgi:hypothetical protein
LLGDLPFFARFELALTAMKKRKTMSDMLLVMVQALLSIHLALR